MKEYKLKLPVKLKTNVDEIVEYLMACHYEDGIFTAGACGIMLNIEKFDFQTKILSKYNINYTE